MSVCFISCNIFDMFDCEIIDFMFEFGLDVVINNELFYLVSYWVKDFIIDFLCDGIYYNDLNEE